MEFIQSHKKATFVAGAILVAAIVLITVIAVLSNQKDIDKTPIIEETGFQTIVPSGKTIKDLGGWERISPLNTTPVYAFADKIGAVTVSVSQQPLPFTDDIDGQVGQLAAAYSATNILDASGTKIYIGTSAKGPQSTIFSKNNLLVLIKSQEKIDDKSWITYINSLE